ncbi:MAG: hypothetical protein ACM31C_07910 [Acidobacteriota bacterium]
MNLATAYPPELGARFRYFERLRPQPSFSQIVDKMVQSDPDFHVHQVGEMTRVVTLEGEYGAWVAVEGQREGGRAMRYIGAVFMDDFATALDAIAIISPHFQTIERLSIELTRSQRFEMYRRPRPFFYVPPTGWQGMASGLTANWYPLDFPKNLSTIVVPPASFFDGDAESAIEATFADVGAGLSIETTVRDELTSAAGVKGAFLRISGRREGRAEPIYREMAMYVIAPYAYRMRLETTNATALLALRETFRGVAGSFRPLPSADESRTGRAFSAPLDLFDHWAS